MPGAHGKFGDFLALLSAVPGVLYLTLAKSVRSKIPVTVFIFGVMVFGQLMILGFLTLTSPSLEFNRNMYDGVFGWLNLDRLPVIFYMAVFINSVGTMGFVRGKSLFSHSSFPFAIASTLSNLCSLLLVH
jgi:drug/metabolite transporter (DMT)-like permease